MINLSSFFKIVVMINQLIALLNLISILTNYLIETNFDRILKNPYN